MGDENKKRGSCGIIVIAIVLLFIVVRTFSGLMYSEDAKHADEIIMQIGEVNEYSGEKIDEARKAYNDVEDGHKQQVRKIKVLENAEKEYQEIQYRKKAAEVDEFIAAIGDISLENSKAIAKARKKYDSLTEEEKAYVTAYAELTMAENEYDALCEDTVDSLEQKIKNVEKQYTADDSMLTNQFEEALSEAVALYESLPSAYRQQVKGKETLSEIQSAYSDYRVAKAQELINAAIDTNEGFSEAKQEYMELSSEEKDKISRYDEMKDAEEAFQKAVKRQSYIASCETVSYDSLRRYPDTYDGKKIQVSLTIKEVKPDGLIFNGDILAVISGTNSEVAVHDSREVREPRFLNGDSVVVYGTGDGLVKEVSYVKGSGLFGSDFLADKVDEREIPAIDVVYTNKD